MRIRTFLAAVILSSPVLHAPAVRADVVRLHDGTTLNGDIQRAADGWLVTDSAGRVTHVPATRVKSIEPTARGDSKEVAARSLASLRRSVEALPDVKTIVDRYQKFLDQNKDSPAAADARKDLAQWKDRQAQGMVKVGNKWVLPEERAALQVRALAVIDEAREQVKQNKLREADATVTRALEVDPTNVSALYLKGLLQYRQDQIPAARKTFEAVRERMPDHGPALNNLAVVLWRQNQHLQAIGAYAQAMQVMPLNKEVLNNVAEALNTLTDEQRRAQIVQKAYKLWTEQDAQLQQQMMPLGWYRWGATWVDKAQYEKLQAAERAVKEKMVQMEADFAETQARVATIDAQMSQNNEAMRIMENNRWVPVDASGRSILMPLPPQYWEYDRANRRLEVQRNETLAALDALRVKAQTIKQQLPVPKYTGAQLMIGVEGTPAIVPSDATVRPAAGSNPGAAPPNVAKNPLDAPAPVNPLDTAAPPPSKSPTPAPTPETPKATDEKPAAPPADRPLKY